MIGKSFTTENIDYKNSYLSVVLEADSFFYGVFNENFTLLELDHVNSLFSASINNEKALSRKYKKKIILDKSSVIHLPDNINDTKIVSDHLVSLPYSHAVRDQVIDQNATSNYMIDNSLYEFISASRKEYEITHISTAMCHYLYPSLDKKVMIHIGDDVMHVCVSSPDGLRFYNQYICNNENDYLYYLAALYQLLNLDQEITTLYLSGSIEPQGKLYTLIKNYFDNVDFASPLIFRFPETKEDHEPHHYMDLYMAYLCVL